MATVSFEGSSNKIHSRTSDLQYTDVVIIGNGPSGICLSFMLSGHWPYYGGATHPNEYLELRLQDGGTKTSIVEQNLELLSDGLEGRSPNPVALLFDALTHPDADMGMETTSLLHWEHHADRVIPHVVLGRKAEGGVWQMVDGHMQTLSLGNWMQLPGMPFKEWLNTYRKSLPESEQEELYNRNRASIQEVGSYYRDYVQDQGLKPYFQNYSTVTSVERVIDVSHTIDSESGEQAPCSGDHSGKLIWEVRGHQVTENPGGETDVTDFCYRAPSIVLATGNFDLPKKLGVPGEHFPYVLSSLGQLEEAINTDGLNSNSDPVLIVGAGLSAGDAILYTQSYHIPIIHVFRRGTEDPHLIYKQLPSKLYPEYHQVHQMMRDGATDDGYSSFSTYDIVEFKEDGKVLLRSRTGSGDIIVQTSYVLVLIGAYPDLSFLPENGNNLGNVPGMSIDCTHNPINVDPYTFQSTYECGMYAMGPLVGENFVRFLRGGALGITAHMWRKKEGKL